MSTKDLSRSIIEGGRRPYNKFDRRQSHREERQAGRVFIHKALISDDEAFCAEKRRKVGKEFNDKLGPAYAWLGRHVGQRWDEVYAKIRQEFDVRTTAGRHIVFDHMLTSVALGGVVEKYRYYRYQVDDEGILRVFEKNPKLQEAPKAPWRKPISNREVAAWSNSRLVIDYGATQFWAEPQDYGWRVCDGFVCGREHKIEYYKEKVLVAWYSKKDNTFVAAPQVIDGRKYIGYRYDTRTRKLCRQGYGGFRQTERLSKEDVAIWQRLNEYQREALAWKKMMKKF